MNSSSLLLEPLRAGAFELKNRMIMAPLTRCRASEGRVPNAMMAEYYAQRASAGLILSEATSISPMAVGYPNTPGIWSEEQVEGWKLVTDAVHQADGKIVLQLWHVGRVSDPMYLDGAQPVAPSAIAPPGHVSGVRPERAFVTPRALEIDEIKAIVEDYRLAAERAKRAGFDGVEIHGANGYLLEQFLNKSSNLRTDEYGGSVENRARLMIEVTDAVVSVWGADRVGLHLSPHVDDSDADFDEAMVSYGYVAEQAGERELAFLFAREGKSDPYFGPELRKRFGGVYVANQNLSFEQGQEMIEKQEADAISWGRMFISNPDLVERHRLAAELTEPNAETFYGEGAAGYTDYSFLQAEAAS